MADRKNRRNHNRSPSEYAATGPTDRELRAGLDRLERLPGSFFFLTQFLQEISHYGALTTGFAFLPMAVSIFVMSWLVPALLPRTGPKPPAATGTLLMTAGLAWLSQLSAGDGYVAAMLGPMLLMGIGGGLAFSPLNVVIMATVPPEDAGAPRSPSRRGSHC